MKHLTVAGGLCAGRTTLDRPHCTHNLPNTLVSKIATSLTHSAGFVLTRYCSSGMGEHGRQSGEQTWTCSYSHGILYSHLQWPLKTTSPTVEWISPTSVSQIKCFFKICNFGVEKQICEKQYQFKKVRWVKGEKKWEEMRDQWTSRFYCFCLTKGLTMWPRVAHESPPLPLFPKCVPAIHELVAEGQCQLSSRTVGSEVTREEEETPTRGHKKNWNLATCNRTKELPVKKKTFNNSHWRWHQGKPKPPLEKEFSGSQNKYALSSWWKILVAGGARNNKNIVLASHY